MFNLQAATLVAAIVLISVFSYGDARSIREQEYSKILDARHQAAYNYRRQPGYAESNHFTAEEAAEMRKARREERATLKSKGMKAHVDTESEQSGPDEEEVNLREYYMLACNYTSAAASSVNLIITFLLR